LDGIHVVNYTRFVSKAGKKNYTTNPTTTLDTLKIWDKGISTV